jgi:hypothetical protein
MNAIEFSKSLFCAMDKSATGEIGYANHSDISVLSAPSTDGETLLTTIGHPVAGGSVQVSVRSKPHNNFTENLVSLVIHTHAKYAEYLNAYYATGHHDKVYFRSTLDQQLIDLELSNNNGNPVDEDAILDELFIPRFKNMQVQRNTRKRNQSQWKYGNEVSQMDEPLILPKFST